ncbi:MAG: creatininase family protein [Armatimonadota bacterium]
MAEFRLTHLRMPEAVEGRFEVAVFPIGSTEPHAFHLAYGTDVFATERFAEQAVAEANKRGARCLLLPTLPISCNENVRKCPWAMSLQPRTLMDIVFDVVTTCERNGLRKVVLLNGHGGNTHVLQGALRELASRSSAFVGFAEPFGLADDVAAEVQETEETGHACEMETSLMLHLAPEHAKMGEAKPTRTRKTFFSNPGSIFFVRPWHVYTLNCGIGDPTKASAEKGRRMVEAAVDRLATALKELSDAPFNELFPYKD